MAEVLLLARTVCGGPLQSMSVHTAPLLVRGSTCQVKFAVAQFIEWQKQ